MSAPGFEYATPIFCSTDLAAALRHYVDVLGFEVQWQWSDDKMFDGGTPTYACVRRGNVSLFIGQERQGVPGAWLSLHVLDVAEVDALYAEYQASGADIVQPPTDQPWGDREMLVKDPDANVLRIGTTRGK